MVAAHTLVKAFKRNTMLVEMHTEGISHAQSLTQTPYNINCMNWVVGHLIGSRRDLLENLGADLDPLPEIDRYARESDPIKGDGPDVVPLATLTDLFAATYLDIRATLGSLSADQLNAEVGTGEDAARRIDEVHFYYFHDTYHVGQIDLLRQISGMNDSII